MAATKVVRYTTLKDEKGKPLVKVKLLEGGRVVAEVEPHVSLEIERPV